MNVDYLRISLTDMCNFNCIYCRPRKGVKIRDKSELLSFEEIKKLVNLAGFSGITKVRLTGGEPLLRKDLPTLARMIVRIKSIREVSITTNGTKLESLALKLKESGISRVNVSLSSLKRRKFARITGRDSLPQVLRGIEAARRANLTPIKINVVILKGINDDEILDFVEFAQKNSLVIRFIEHMPINGIGGTRWYIPNSHVKSTIEKKWGKLEPTSFIGNGPATYYQLKESGNPIGFISFISHSFCERCNRLRLTFDGKLRPCLLSSYELDLKNVLRDKNCDEADLKKIFDLALGFKKEKRTGNISIMEKFHKTGKFMFQIGG